MNATPFGKLLLASKRLPGMDPRDIDAAALPVAAPGHNFDSILANLTSIASRAPPTATEDAQRLLMSRNVDIVRLQQENTQMKFQERASEKESTVGSGSTNVEDFLKKLHKAIRGTVIAEATSSTAAFLHMHSTLQEDNQWEGTKKDILKSLGLQLPSRDGDATATLQQQQQQQTAARIAPTLLDFADFPFAPASEPAPASRAADTTTDVRLGRGIGDSEIARGQTDIFAAQLSLGVRTIAAASQGNITARSLPCNAIAELQPAVQEEDMRRPSGSFATTANDMLPTAADAFPFSRFWTALEEITRENMAGGVGFRCYSEGFGGDVLSSLQHDSLSENAAQSTVQNALDVVTKAAASATNSGRESAQVPFTSGMGAGMQMQWLAGSLSYLQALRRHVLHQTVNDAHRSGASGMRQTPQYNPENPGEIALVQEYVQILIQHGTDLKGEAPQWAVAEAEAGTRVDGLPLFPQLMLLLQIGALAQAQEVLQKAIKRRPGDHELAALSASLALYSRYFDALCEDTGRGYDAVTVASTVAVQKFVAEVAVGHCRPVVDCGKLFAKYDTEMKLNPDQVDAKKLLWKTAVFGMLGGIFVNDEQQIPGGDPDRLDDITTTDIHSFLWHKVWFASASPLLEIAAVTAAIGIVGLRVSEESRAATHINAAAISNIAAGAKYTIGHVSAGIVEYGPAHFDPDGKAAYRYAEALLLTGQPEAAVVHLATRGAIVAPHRHLHDAVHLAIVCNYYGILRVRPSQSRLDSKSNVVEREIPHTNSLLYLVSKREKHTVALDLEAMFRLYCTNILKNSPIPIADYYSLLPDVNDRIQLLSEALVSTSAFETYAGPLSLAHRLVTPSVESGYLSRHGFDTDVTPLDEVYAIILEAARICEEHGRSVDALHLYLRVPRAEDGLLHALRVLIKALARLHNEPWLNTFSGGRPESSPIRTALREVALVTRRTAEEVLGIGSSRGSSLSASFGTGYSHAVDATAVSLGSTVEKLLQLCVFFDSLAAGNYFEALRDLDNTDLLPSKPSEAEWARIFDPLSEELKVVFPTLLEAARATLQGYANLLRTKVRPPGAEDYIQLRQRVRALYLHYTPLMDQYIPKSVKTSIAQLDNDTITPM